MLSSTYLFNICLKLIKCRNVEVFLPAIMDTLKMYMTNRMFLCLQFKEFCTKEHKQWKPNHFSPLNTDPAVFNDHLKFQHIRIILDFYFSFPIGLLIGEAQKIWLAKCNYPVLLCNHIYTGITDWFCSSFPLSFLSCIAWILNCLFTAEFRNIQQEISTAYLHRKKWKAWESQKVFWIFLWCAQRHKWRRKPK